MPSSLKKVAVGRMMPTKGRSEEGGGRSGGAAHKLRSAANLKKISISLFQNSRRYMN